MIKRRQEEGVTLTREKNIVKQKLENIVKQSEDLQEDNISEFDLDDEDEDADAAALDNVIEQDEESDVPREPEGKMRKSPGYHRGDQPLTTSIAQESSKRLHELFKGRVGTTAYQPIIGSNEW